VQFRNVYYDPDKTVYCTENHRDPDGKKYGHAHLPHFFPFNVRLGGEAVAVTVQKSDWAWDAHYAGYTKVSGSTFALNCFAYAVSAPTVMFLPGWEAFTAPSSLAEETAKTRSYGNQGHVVKILIIQDRGEGQNPRYIVTSTIEKNASGGVYRKNWDPPNGAATFGVVRKRK
jgi:hypothetical protein